MKSNDASNATETRSPELAGRTPYLDALLTYRAQGYAPFSCPGHRHGRGASAKMREAAGSAFLDVDAAMFAGIEDTRQSLHLLEQAESLAAEAWNVDRAFFLVNGSTSGVQALAYAVTRPGREVILPRNAHKSLHAALIHTGAVPIWVDPGCDPTWGVPLPMSVQAAATALAAHPQATALMASTPTWEGLCADVGGLRAAVDSGSDIPLVIDQAWGANLRFCSQLPREAIEAGADACVTSIHKMLGGLTQSALLLARGDRIDLEHLQTAVRMTQTTSPHVQILASIDAARADMAASGEGTWRRALSLAGDVRAAVEEIDGITCLGDECLGWEGVADYDRTHVILSASSLGASGWDLETHLRDRHAVTVDGADEHNVVVLVSHGNTSEDVRRLVAGLRAFAEQRRERQSPSGPSVRFSELRPPLPRQIMTPRAAYYARTTTIPLAESVGSVSGELLTPYPPGIPVVVPGEEMSGEIVEFIGAAVANGVPVHGSHDPSLKTIRVVDEPA